ncbi:MAG TPA: M28 family peptidase [bacterium]|nr:M28 family peptidase [bacterium]
MGSENLYQIGKDYLKKFCIEISERCVGSAGNRKATRFFEEEIASLGWNTKCQKFDAIDWRDGGAILKCDNLNFEVFASPYSLGCDLEAYLVSASNVDELEKLNMDNKIVLLHGKIAQEQLMPKNFEFYNPAEHKRIISLLEKGQPKAIVCAPVRNVSSAGGEYPFPIIEDGDFDIPSVFMTEEEGHRLMQSLGKKFALKSKSKRISAQGYNIVARKGSSSAERLVFTAHIDAKKGSPGAIDNATGVITLLILARLLKDYHGERPIEIVALNGEDYYAASGQKLYIRENKDEIGDFLLNITIDGAGYKEGNTIFSLFDLPPKIRNKVKEVMDIFENIEEGPQYPQGDHSIFLQNGCPAIAVSSKWLIDNLYEQKITHTSQDNINIVEIGKVIEIARALNLLSRKL